MNKKDLFVHFTEMRKCDLRFLKERDRRYTEVSKATASALRVAESAAKEALALAREAQHERDVLHNGLLDQLKAERATYATKTEMKPLTEWMIGQTGRYGGLTTWAGWILAILTLLVMYFKK